MMDRNVMQLYREDHDAGDPWGSAMSYLFPLAEIIRAQDGVIVDGYRPSPFVAHEPDRPLEYGDDDTTTTLWDGLTIPANDDAYPFVDGFAITMADIRYAYRVLDRYADLADAAGRSY